MSTSFYIEFHDLVVTDIDYEYDFEENNALSHTDLCLADDWGCAILFDSEAEAEAFKAENDIDHRDFEIKIW